MAKTILTTDLSKGLQDATTEAGKLLSEFKSALDIIKELSSLISKEKGGLNLGDAKDLEKFNKEFADTNKLVEQRIKLDNSIVKVEKQRAVIAKKKKELTDDEIKQSIVQRRAAAQRKKDIEAELILETKSIKNKRDLQDRIKALRIEGSQLDLGSDELKKNIAEIDDLVEKLSDSSDEFIKNKINIGNYKSATEDLTVSFKDQKKKLDILEETYKDFRLSGAKATKESKELKDALDKQRKALNELKEGADDSRGAVDKLTGAVKTLAAATIILKAFEFVADLFTASDAGADGLAKTLGRLTISVQVFIGRAVNSFDAFKNKFFVLINDVQLKFFQLIDTLNIDIDLGPLGKFEQTLIDVSGNIAKLKAEQEDLKKKNTDVAGSFKGLTDEINKKIAANDKAIDQERINILTLAQLELKAAKLSNTLEELALSYDDDSQALSDRSTAIKEAITIQEQLNETTLKAAKLEEETARLRAEASTGSAQAQADFLAAQSKRIEIETQGLTELNDKRRENNSINRDIRDLELDVLLDNVDNKKTVNEREFANEELAQNKRRKLLEENKNLIETSFKSQAEVVNKELEDLGKSSIDFQQLLNKSSEDLAKFLKDNTGETQALRILEILKERRTALQDIVDTQKELSESDREIIATNKDIILQEEALNALSKEGADSEQIFKELEQERAELKKETLKEEIALLEKKNELEGGDSLTLIEKKQELNEILLTEDKKRTDNEKKENEKRKADSEATQKVIQDNIFKTSQAALNGLVAQSTARQQSINEEIQEAKTRRTELIRLSASTDSQTSQLAADSLAKEREFERQKTAELEKEKKKQIRLELLLSGLKAYQANAGQPNAATKTIVDVGVLVAGLTAAAGSFYEGTDRLGTNGKGIDSKGGMLNVNHPDEMIIQKDLNKKMGYPDRHDVAEVFTRYKNGDLLDKGVTQGATLQTVFVNSDNSEVVNVLKSVKKELRNANNAQLVVDTARAMISIKERKGNRINKYLN